MTLSSLFPILKTTIELLRAASPTVDEAAETVNELIRSTKRVAVVHAAAELAYRITRHKNVSTALASEMFFVEIGDLLARAGLRPPSQHETKVLTAWEMERAAYDVEIDYL